MKVLIQRVKHASVEVAGEIIGHIDHGLLALVAIQKDDTEETLQRMANKLLSYRVFADTNRKMNMSVQDIQGGVLAISQFTLAANTQKGLRPSFSKAAPPEYAESLYNTFMNILRSLHPNIEQGRFAADMQVSLLNDGPVTFMLEI